METYQYVLDILEGGNFLGTPALEASCIIESLFGIPPVNEVKIETSLEDVMKKLETIERNFPSVETKLEMLLDKTDELDKSLGGIDERISVLWTCVVHDNQINGIGELEKAMGTLGSTFSSLKYKEKAYVGKEQKFMYVSKVRKPKKYYYRPKIDKALSTTTDGGAYGIDAPSLDNTWYTLYAPSWKALKKSAYGRQLMVFYYSTLFLFCVLEVVYYCSNLSLS